MELKISQESIAAQVDLHARLLNTLDVHFETGVVALLALVAIGAKKKGLERVHVVQLFEKLWENCVADEDGWGVPDVTLTDDEYTVNN
jgi:hypothetical protein